MAREAGYDIAELKARKDAPEIEARLRETYELAESLGLQGTPSFVIGEQIVRGFLDYDAMVETVAEARGSE
jgi:2-hydroxychromene-2-carboxylate isomerase